MDTADAFVTLPYRPFRLALLGLTYSAPLGILMFIMSFGEPGAMLIFLAFMAGAVSFMTLRMVHKIVSTDLEVMQYAVSGFMRAFWISIIPLVIIVGALFGRLVGMKYALVSGSAIAAVFLFLVIGLILACMGAKRYAALWILVGASWVLLGAGIAAGWVRL